jgi:hypothetical protein
MFRTKLVYIQKRLNGPKTGKQGDSTFRMLSDGLTVCSFAVWTDNGNQATVGSGDKFSEKIMDPL